MQITHDDTGLCSGLTTWLDPRGTTWCVVVVKGTFEATSEGELSRSEAQRPLITTDEYEGEPGRSSLRAENDFAPPKLAVDLVVRGEAWAPRGKSCTSQLVELRLGEWHKRLVVHGPRTWRPGLAGLVPSAPRPFERAPLRWEDAYGGTSDTACELRNPVGRGLAAGVSANEILERPAPSIEDPERAIKRWGPRYEPAGIAAISRGWQPRLAAAGTFDDAWRRERFPLLPLDFDVAHFQIAPPDQRFAELDPGTPILATNMSASGLFRARVPPPPPPVWFCFEDRTLERAVTLDTLVVEPGAGVLLACWRTAVPLGRSPDQLREVRIGANPMSVAAPVGRRRKPHFRSLGEAVAWARRQRKARRR